MAKTFLERLDDAVRWTGIPAVAAHQQRRRPMLVLPVLALFIATTALIILLARPDLYGPGYGLLMLGFTLSNFIPIFGPILPWSPMQPADERERALRRSAFLVGFTAIGIAAWCGLWLLVGLAQVNGWTVDRLTRSMTALAFYLTTLYGAVPTLWASWQLRPLPEDD